MAGVELTDGQLPEIASYWCKCRGVIGVTLGAAGPGVTTRPARMSILVCTTEYLLISADSVSWR